MRVRMPKWLMRIRMHVRLRAVPREIMLMLVMGIRTMRMRHGLMFVFMGLCVSVKCRQMPAPISPAAIQNRMPELSLSRSNQIAAPTKDTAEKYAPVRAVPSCHSASTN